MICSVSDMIPYRQKEEEICPRRASPLALSPQPIGTSVEVEVGKEVEVISARPVAEVVGLADMSRAKGRLLSTSL